jgi:exodeoxyribonuclease (lambda-induced)
MIISESEQGSTEWMAERAGVATASNFSSIFTSAGKKSTSAKGYMNSLLAEWLTGEKTSIKPSEWMLRGVEMEAEAKLAYEIITGHAVTEVGLCYQNKDRSIGASPDGLIAYDEMEENKDFEFGLEIKCPMASNHVAYILGKKIPTSYIQQVQGSMFVTGLDRWDFMSYHPDIKPFIITVERDEKLMTAIKPIMDDFIGEMLVKRETLFSLVVGK